MADYYEADKAKEVLWGTVRKIDGEMCIETVFYEGAMAIEIRELFALLEGSAVMVKSTAANTTGTIEERNALGEQIKKLSKVSGHDYDLDTDHSQPILTEGQVYNKIGRANLGWGTFRKWVIANKKLGLRHPNGEDGYYATDVDEFIKNPLSDYTEEG